MNTAVRIGSGARGPGPRVEAPVLWRVLSVLSVLLDDVEAGAAVEDVEAWPADQDVVAVAAEQGVVAVAADEEVVACAAVHRQHHRVGRELCRVEDVIAIAP